MARTTTNGMMPAEMPKKMPPKGMAKKMPKEMPKEMGMEERMAACEAKIAAMEEMMGKGM